MLLFPGKAELLQPNGDNLTSFLADTNRLLDADWLACPSFHMIWAVYAALCIRQRFPQLTLVAVAMVLLTGASCLLTGSHAAIDVIVGVPVALVCWHHKSIWEKTVRGAEALGNSWAAIEFGPLRIINHALWSAIAAGIGISLVLWMVGPHLAIETALVFTSGLIVAGAWGYWLEGSNRLSRPFGYYGFLFGAIGALVVLAIFDRTTAQTIMAAFSCAAPLAQAIGRLRCLIQGCCHGRPTITAPGICITHPMSRVSALSELHGVRIHPTQLYSAAANLMIFALLWRQWECGATTTFIGGLYLILSSLARFAEEGYRGEKQTPYFFNLAIYQWLAVVLCLTGIGLSMIEGNSVHLAATLTKETIMGAVLAALLAALLMSIDFPKSQRRFSRLTVLKY